MYVLKLESGNFRLTSVIKICFKHDHMACMQSFQICSYFIFQAAGHIHRFRSLDENVLRLTEVASEGSIYSHLRNLLCPDS